MKLIAISILVLLTGCLGKMEKVTSDTKDAVEDTKKGQRLAAALVFLFDEHFAPAIRASGADTVLSEAPDNRIFRYLGCRLPLSFGTDPETKVANVSRVLLPTEWDQRSPGYPGVSAPISPTVLLALEDAALNILKLSLMVAKGSPTSELFEEFRARAVRLVASGTAIFGARSHSNMNQYYRDLVPIRYPIISRKEEVEVRSDFVRLRGAKLLRDVAEAYKFSDDEKNALKILMSERLGIDYKAVDELIEQMKARMPEYDSIDK